MLGKLLHGLGAACVRLRWLVVGIWILAAVGITLVVGQVGAETNNNLTLPGADSQIAYDVLEQYFPPQQNGSSQVVFHTTNGRLDDGGVQQQAVTDTYNALVNVPHVASVTDPFANAASGLVSADGTYAFIPVLLDIDSGQLDEPTAQAVFDAATKPADAIGMEIAVGGPVGAALSKQSTESSEIIGLLAAMVILAFTFGSLVAMGLPILTAVFGLAIGLGAIGLLGHLIDIPTIGPTLATMIGLGVGIDYALFLVTKHRSQIHEQQMSVKDSVAEAVATSGGAIVFAGGTVIVALLALAVAQIPFVTSLGYACAVGVFTAVLAALTLLPAMLAILGRGVDRLALPSFMRPRAKNPDAGLWARWAAMVIGHPVISCAVAMVVMVPLVIPVFTLTLGQADTGVSSTSTTQRVAFDLISAGFGPGYNGPLVVSVLMDPPAQESDDYTAEYDQATSMQTDLEGTQQTLTDQADSLTQQQADLQAQEDDLNAQKATLEQEESDLQTQVDALNVQKAALEKQQADLQTQSAALSKQADDLQKQADSLSKQAADLQKQADSLTAQQQAAQQQAAAQAQSGANPAEASANLAALQQTQASLTAQADDLAKQEADLQEQQDELKKEEADLQTQEADLQKQADALTKQANSLQAQGDALAAQGADLQAQAEDLQAQADDLQAQGDQLQKQADDLTEQQTTAEQEQQDALGLQDDLTAQVTTAGGDPRGTDPRIVRLQDALGTPSGVQRVIPPMINEAGNAVVISVIATTRPADQSTAELVNQLRTEVIPLALAPGMQADVGGNTANNVDLAAVITAKLPIVIFTVIALSFLLLLIAFRSLLIPVQAAITNLLSAAAAFGVVTAVFQWGWGLSAIGLSSPYGTVPIASFVPLMMFAALFGLSMDYQVFFISHVQGLHGKGMSHKEAVRSGLASSAKIIGAAALIMIAVFGSFILIDDPVIKQFGVGLSVAVALAAFLVLLLAPALLTLFGERTWHLPKFLDRILPDLDLEGNKRSGNASVPASPEPKVASGTSA
jgi:uncharacterized membrane protein YdfJ with MMPL/SSD domain